MQAPRDALAKVYRSWRAIATRRKDHETTRRPEQTTLYRLVQENAATFFAHLDCGHDKLPVQTSRTSSDHGAGGPAGAGRHPIHYERRRPEQTKQRVVVGAEVFR
jgi:hypothetical protein